MKYGNQYKMRDNVVNVWIDTIIFTTLVEG